MTSEPAKRPAELVIVTGLSGAGRSTALHALEDLGFFCVDNLPPQAFASALDACTRDGLAYVAFGIDVRVGTFLKEAVHALTRTPDNYRTTLLFLDASNDALETRFGSTRRPHPLRVLKLTPDGQAKGATLSVSDGIALERERLVPLRARASVVIDTTELSVHELRREVLRLFRPSGARARGLVIRFLTFGFKYGPAVGCDTLFDVRFLDNPFFVPALRPLSGQDPSVAEFVRKQPDAESFFRMVTDLLAFLLPRYEQEGKSYLTVGFGCTGGRHRSVCMAEWVAQELASRLDVEIDLVHRDVARARNSGESIAPEAG